MAISEFDYPSLIMRILAFYSSAVRKGPEVTSVHELESCCGF